MAGEEMLPFSTMEIYTENDTHDKTTKNTTSSINHSVLPSATLVPLDSENEITCTTYHIPSTTMENNRMEIISQKRKQDEGSNEDTIELLSHAQRTSTRKQYNHEWKKWTQWCSERMPTITPTNYNPKQVLLFRFLGGFLVSNLRSRSLVVKVFVARSSDATQKNPSIFQKDSKKYKIKSN